MYGTPIFITDDERRRIYTTDLSYDKRLEQQRDIFIFQCLIGCRISDLYALRRSNVITERTSKGDRKCISYIPRKTKDGHPVTVHVPLNETALAILKKYDYMKDGSWHSRTRSPARPWSSYPRCRRTFPRHSNSPAAEPGKAALHRGMRPSTMAFHSYSLTPAGQAGGSCPENG